MKKVLLFLCSIILFIPSLLADDLVYVKDGVESVMSDTEDVIYLIKDNFDLNKVFDNSNLITIDGDFKLIRNRAYTVAEMKDGTYTSDRTAGNIYSYRLLGPDVPVLVYTKSLSVGAHTIGGSIKMLFKGAVADNDGAIYDLNMEMSNITIKVGTATTKPIAILSNVPSHKEIWYRAYPALQEDKASYYKSTYSSSKYKSTDYVTQDFTNSSIKVGVTYDTKFYVTKPNSNELVNKKMILIFRDIDRPDRIAGGYLNSSNKPNAYTESITLKEGIVSDVHLQSNSYLNISDTTFGKKTRYAGTTSVDDELSLRAAFGVKVNSAGFKINWSGSYCATGIGLLNLLSIKARVIGDYPDKVTHLTPDDNAIINESDKTIELTPNDGYFVKKFYIDGVEVNMSKLSHNESTNTYTYTFQNITDNHLIEFELETNLKKYVIHYDGNDADEGEMEDTAGVYDETGVLSPNEFVKEGYDFVGWVAYIKDENDEFVPLIINGEKVVFEDEDDFLNLYGENEEEVTLYAQWVEKTETPEEKEKYLIHYDGNDADEGEMEDTIATYDEPGVLSPNEFVKDGYYFYGWKPYYRDENEELVPLIIDGKEAFFEDKDDFLNLYGDKGEEVTLYAQWLSNPKTGLIDIHLVTLFAVLLSGCALLFMKKKQAANNK